MDRKHIATLARLKPYQIAGLAILTSTAASVGVLVALRRYVFPKVSPPPDSPEADLNASKGVSPHFSEELTVPGFTHTGEEILEEDNRHGRSAEGV